MSRCPRITPAGKEATASSKTRSRAGAAPARRTTACTAVIEDILDWRPFDYVTQTALLPIPGAPKFLITYAFEERDDGGTHFEFRVAKPKPKDLPFYEQVWSTVEKNFNVGFEILRTMLEEQRAEMEAADEPALPVSRARFATQPVQAR